MAGETRQYRTDQIVVHWNADRCIHTANCIRSLPRVFNPRDRPWVQIDAAAADEIATAVLRCPTGALHFERLDGGPEEQAPETTTIRAMPNGPLYVQGEVTVLDGGGGVIRRDTRMALCRCGESGNKPFCDNSHLRVGFRDAARARTTPP